MSIINKAHPGSQIRLLCMIDRALNRRRQQPVSSEELIALLSPEALPDSDTGRERLPKNLNFWIEEGLWKSDADGISSQFITANENDLPARVLRLIIDNENGTLLTGSRGQPFLLAISALYTHDQFTFRGNNILKREDVSALVGPLFSDANAGDEKRRLNASEDSELLRYGQFLGFLEPHLDGGYLLDPTRAITPVLPALFNNDSQLRVKEFMARLVEFLPMLDGGSYRQVVEPLMDNINHDNQRHQISKALSHALCRLETSFTIGFDTLADDSDALFLQHPDGTTKQVSSILLREVNS